MPQFKVNVDGAEYEVDAASQQEADALARHAHSQGVNVGESITLDDIVVTPESNPPEDEPVAPTETKPEPSTLQKIGDIFTGDLRKTPETESLQDWAKMPELNEVTFNSFRTALGTMMTNPEETAGIIKAQYPDVQMRTDYNGNIILKSSIDGKEYAIKPGAQVSDIPRAIGSIAAFTPAGRATSALGLAGASAATQGAVEGIEAASGGNLNPENIALAGAIPGAGGILSALKNRILGRPTQQAVQSAMESAAPVAQAVPESLPLEAVSATAKKAGEGSKSAMESLATQASPDTEKVAAAKRLGIEEYLQPDHVTTNQVYRELAQAVKSYPGSIARAEELQGLQKVTQAADDIIGKLAANDVSAISDSAKRELQSAHDMSFKEAGKLYDELRASIPATTRVSADNILATIKDRADELGGEEYLSAPEKLVLKKLSPKDDGTLPTYALLDDVRRDIVAAKFKGQGAFKDSDDRILDILNNGLREDQKSVAEQFGKGDTFELAQKTAATYKSIQDDLKSLFGKDISGSIVSDMSASARALSKGDTSKFLSLVSSIKYLPKEQQQQIIAGGLRTAFGEKLASGQMNFGSYAKWYRGLKENKQAYTALMSNLPKDTVRSLDDLYKVSEGISAASRERIQTGRIQVVEDIVKNADTAIGKMYEAVKGSTGKVALGGLADIIGTGGAGMAFALGSALAKKKEPAMKSIDAVLTSPQFAKAVANPNPENVRKLAYDKRFVGFMKNVTSNADLNERERFIMSIVQAEKPKE